MKKRILSLLLLAAMLVTMVPVVASAAEATVSDDGDFAELYVTDGLVGLFTAFGEADSVTLVQDGSSGKWANRVQGGFDATLGNGKAWYKGSTYSGGIGFNVFSGEITKDGTFNKTSQYDTWKYSYTFLNFGGANLPDADYSVEYLAMHKPVYVVNAADGSIAVDPETGAYIESHDKNPGFSAGVQDVRTDKAPLFALGYFNAFGVALDTDTSTWGMMRGCMVWTGNQHNWSGDQKGWWIGTGSCTYNRNSGMSWNWTTNDAFIKNNKVITYMITLDETTTATETTDEETGATGTTTTTTALFSLYRDGSVWQSNEKAINSTANAKGCTYYIDGDKSNFYLSAGVPIEYYAVRIYDKVLTEAEIAQNRAVDILHYYDLTVRENVVTDEPLQKRIFAAFGSETFEIDATLKAEKKLELQAELDAMSPVLADAMSLYVTDNLVDLYTAFVGDTSAVETAVSTTGLWANRVYGGESAALRSHSYNRPASFRWSIGRNGGVGYEVHYGTLVDGTYTATAVSTHTVDPQVRLGIPAATFPVDDFTVEFLAMQKPVYVEDGNGNIAYVDGKPVELYGQTGNGIRNANGWSSYKLGWFNGYYHCIDGFESTWGGHTRGTMNWFYGSGYWDNWSGNWVGGVKWSGNGGLAISGNPFMQNNVINTYEVSVDETLTAAEDGTSVTTALLALYRNGVLYKDNSSNISSTAKTSGTAYSANAPTGAAYDGYFHLAATVPTDFYSVRVYAKTLTVAEREQNRMADVLLYYDLMVPVETLNSETKLAALKALLVTQTFETGAAEYAAVKAMLQYEINGVIATGTDASNLFVKDGLTALYTAYDDTYVNLDAGKWYDCVAGATATLGNKQFWTTGANGGVGVTQLWGSYIDGTFSADSETALKYNTNDVTGTRLDFGIDQLPMADYTIEYIAKYGNIMAVNANGTPVVAINTLADAVWPSNTASITGSGSVSYNPIDQIGNLSSLTYQRNGHFAGASAAGTYGPINSVSWQYNSNRPANLWNSGDGQYYGGRGMHKPGDSFHKVDGVHSYEISRSLFDGTATINEVETPVTYSQLTISRDMVTFASKTPYTDISNEHTGGNDYFYLAERLTVDFYAVRIYNRVLTAAEKQQNHLADLLLYYNVTIPETLAENADVVAGLASTYASMTFATDSTEKQTNQTTLRGVIDGLKKTVTVKVDDADGEAWTLVGDSYTLPENVDGKRVFAWTVSSMAYIPGMSVTLTDGMTMTAQTITAPVTAKAPSVRANEDIALMGMRFTATMSKTEFLAVVDTYGYANMKVGMLIAPAKYVEAAGAFTKDALEDYVRSAGSTSGAAYIDVESRGFLTVKGNVCTLAASIVNFSAATFGKNPTFGAIAYIEIDTDKDGVKDFTIYGDYDPTTACDPRTALNNALSSATDSETKWIESLLGKFN